MARQNHGPLSRAKGKLGGVVYQQYEGMQISREYQPNVKNPQSEKQTENRAQFKLASQTVGIFKEVINTRLAKYSIYIRIRRGAAVEAIKRKIEWESDTAATLLFDDSIAAINAKSLTEFSAPTVTESAGTISVIAPAQSLIIGVIAGFNSDGEYLGRKVVSASGTSSAVNFTIPAEYASSKSMFVYTMAQTEEGRAIFENLRDSNTDLIVATERLISSGDVEVSDIAGITASV